MLRINEYRQVGGELYARTTVWIPDDGGERLPGRAGRWRHLATIGADIPSGGEPLTESAYEALVAARREQHDAELAQAEADAAARLRDARDHLQRLGIPVDIASVLTPTVDG